MNILIVGGAGYIGSHVNKWLNKQGHQTVVFDNLSRGHRDAAKWGQFVQGDLNNPDLIDQVLQRYAIEAVMHFSAFAYVGESVTSPDMYYRNNVVNTINLLDCIVKNHIRYFIFSSSCATFGDVNGQLIDENCPQNPVNPYGMSKLMVERILSDYSNAYNLCYSVLRYFNAAGADPDGDIGEWHVPETHLIPLVLDAALGKRKSIEIYGSDYPTRDGTCIRDYIHVSDLARAHQLALEWNVTSGLSDAFNFGNGVGYSIIDIVKAVEKVTGCSIAIEWRDRRPGDPPSLVAKSDKAFKLLGYKPYYINLEDIISTAWEWHKLKLR